jgi:hypothetical protein
MPHLHLPTDHTDDDLVLAASVAEIVGSEDLYVAWSHERGAGVMPEVDALLVEPRRVNPLAQLLAAIRRALGGRSRRGGTPRHDSPPDPVRRAPA